jgi:hypothetical protein
MAVNKKDTAKKAIAQDKKKTAKIASSLVANKMKKAEQVYKLKSRLGKNPLKKNLNISDKESYNTTGPRSGGNISDDGIYGRSRSGNKIDKASRKRIK